MSLLKEVDKILKRYDPVPGSLKPGNRINPLHIINLSATFPALDLKREEIILASYKDEGAPDFLLSNHFLYINGNTPEERIPLEKIQHEALEEKGISVPEVRILKETIELILSNKNQPKKTLNDFIGKYGMLLQEEKNSFKNDTLFFDGKYVEMLEHETTEAVKLCQNLNNDSHFIQSLNLIFSNTGEAADGFKAEHLLIADIIKAYNEVAFTENEKSRFTLAYFFESLQGKNLAKGISIQRLNEMTGKEAFNENIEKIKSAQYILPAKEYQDEYLLPSILYRIQHPQFVHSGNIIYRFASIAAKADNTVNEQEKEALKKILSKTAQPKSKASGNLSKDIPENDSLEKVLEELNGLTGLDEVKKSVKELINLLKVQKIRIEKGFSNIEASLHSVFMGPPGTGKTTVARLIGRIYKHLGYLEKGHLLETDRAGMVAGYVGQTAIKVNELVNESIGGVLFIDEAYSLTPKEGGRDFGNEAVDTLLKRMEDLRNQLVVIVAGYTEPMKLFIESNPGLRSRFNRYFKFDHFLPIQLLQIFESFCKKTDFIISDSAKDKLLDTFEMLYEKRDEGFGNARVVRNLFERCVQNQANRILEIPELSEEIILTLKEEDIPEPKDTVQQVYITINE